jgi:mono/diheme cytochrome c family protein/rhodanese-related sulfurtransferase
VNRVAIALIALAFACKSGEATPEPARSTPKPDPSARSSAAAPPAPLDAAALAQVSQQPGKPMYLALCKPCHGADAKGYAADHAPSLINPTFLESASDDFLRRSIRAGRPGTSMAAYGKSYGGPLDDAGIERLVRFLREQGPAARALPATTAGDVAVGAAVYTKRCVACHGDASVRGEAVSLVNAGFLSDASDAFVRHAIVHGRPGTKMEAFAGALSDAEIDGVVSYVRTLGGNPSQIALLPEPTGREPLVLNPSGKPPQFTLRADRCPPAAPGQTSSCKEDPRFVSVDQVARAVAAKQRIVIIDARPPSDWRRVHITGAVSIPYHDMKRLDELPRDGTWVVAYCACPHHLSGIVVDELRKRGHAHSAVLDEGITVWHRRGLPVVAADGVLPPPPELAAPKH